MESSKKVGYILVQEFGSISTDTKVDCGADVSYFFYSVVVDGKSRESTMAFSRVFITVPAGNSG